jgi:hypothetical protein
MQAVQTTNETAYISREKLVSFVSQIFGGTSAGREDDEHPLPPGPWDPMIRKVSNRVFGPRPEPWHLKFGPYPEPWRSELHVNRMILGVIAARHPEIFDTIGGDRFTLAALNPQPLPPRAAFLAAVTEEVIDRALLMQEVADAMNQTGEQRGIIIVGGRLSQFVDGIDELCPRIERKFPKPKGGIELRFSGLELLTAGAVFEQNAATVAHEGLRQELRNAGARLIEAGLARM